LAEGGESGELGSTFYLGRVWVAGSLGILVSVLLILIEVRYKGREQKGAEWSSRKLEIILGS
jgi:hypothetical protein